MIESPFTWAAHLLIATTLVVGCTKEAASTSSPPIAEERDERHVPYRCPPLAGARGPVCRAPPAWLAPLAHAGERAFDDPLCPGAQPALLAASKASAEVPIGVALVAQNAALRLRVACEGGARGLAQPVLERFARPPAELRALGSRPAGLHALLRGPFEERAPIDWPLMHERDEGSTRLFRMGRRGARHALVSQLVAVDTAGDLHVTPVVGGAELRDGDSVDAPACVARLDVGTVSCADGPRLRTVPHSELPSVQTHRYGRVGDGVGCRDCHPQGRAGNLDTEPPGVTHEAERTEALFDGLRGRLARH